MLAVIQNQYGGVDTLKMKDVIFVAVMKINKKAV